MCCSFDALRSTRVACSGTVVVSSIDWHESSKKRKRHLPPEFIAKLKVIHMHPFGTAESTESDGQAKVDFPGIRSPEFSLCSLPTMQ